MFIHKTFSVSELIDIIEIFQMDIPEYYDYYKEDLILYMEIYIQSHKPLTFKNGYFNFKNHYELVDYLQSPNSRFKLTIEKKREINTIAKKVLNYCKSYRIDDFESHFNLANSISLYGDLPSVRKAIIAINRYYNKPFIIEYENSVFYLKEIKQKKYLKKKLIKFKIINKSHNIIF